MGFIWAMSEIALITLENFCVDGIVRLRSIQALKDLLFRRKCVVNPS